MPRWASCSARASTFPTSCGRPCASSIRRPLSVMWRSGRWPAPGAAALGLIAFIVYALLTPSSARHWDGHPGNEPKTLRMAVAIGHGLTLDVEGVSAAMEALPVRGLGGSVRAAAAAVAVESA